MSKAKAVLSFQQIGLLIEGKVVTIRLPDTLEHVAGQPENVTKTVPGITITLLRETLARDTVVEYTVTCKNRQTTKLRISYIDKVFTDMDETLHDMWRAFERLFRLPHSK